MRFFLLLLTLIISSVTAAAAQSFKVVRIECSSNYGGGKASPCLTDSELGIKIEKILNSFEGKEIISTEIIPIIYASYNNAYTAGYLIKIPSKKIDFVLSGASCPGFFIPTLN